MIIQVRSIKHFRLLFNIINVNQDSFDDLKAVVNTHLTRLRSKFFESFKGPVLSIVHSLYQEGLPFEEREYLQYVEDSLMTILNPLEVRIPI